MAIAIEEGRVKTTEIEVEGMHCAGCEQAPTLALSGIEGVRVQADREAERVLVSDPAQTGEPALRERIALCGFTPAEVGA